MLPVLCALRTDVGRDLVAASAVAPVLASLAQASWDGDRMLKRGGERSGGRPQERDGMLHPLLCRFDRLGHVAARLRSGVAQ